MKLLIKKEVKKYIYYLIACFDIIRLLVLTKNHKEKYFFLQVEGGFGFTISSSHLLNIQHGNKWILFFGFRKTNHNKEVEKLYDGKLKFFRAGNLNQGEFRYDFEKFLQTPRVSYESVMKIMGSLSKAGFPNISLVTDSD